MTGTQSGIDILCDAVGSDLLLNSFLDSSSPQRPKDRQKNKRVRVDDEDSSSAKTPHVCHICKRVYERADHLIRHLRSHENARPYQCSRCPKRFNRADLLTRHETTHDRDEGAKGRPMIRRSDRAAAACLNCASSKAKCDDQKPCGRCRSKNLSCQANPRQGSGYGPRDDPAALESPDLTSPSDIMSDAGNAPKNLPFQHKVQLPADLHMDMNDAQVATPFSQNLIAGPNQLLDMPPDDMFFFNPINPTFPDMDFNMSWDLNFDHYTIPPLDAQGPSPQSTSTATSKQNARDPTRGFAAFKRSPWLWEPNAKDSAQKEHEGLILNEQKIASSPEYEKMVASNSSRLKLEISNRDRLFALVLSQHNDPMKIPSFPSLDLLNNLLQTHFIQDDYQIDNWIHSASFDPSKSSPELLAALISSGATFISIPAIWQFGLALLEVARLGISNVFERSNANTREIQYLQTFMLNLDIGLWSGFKRKMEIAESFLQPVVTMLRRASAFSAPVDTQSLIPSRTDSQKDLEVKWRSFIKRESYKRLILHMFFHDCQASASLQHGPLISYTELAFSLPAARDLWHAPTAEAWRDIYLRKKPLTPHTSIPLVSEIVSRVTVLDDVESFIDTDLCHTIVVFGYWGQIAAYREAVRFYSHGHTASLQRSSSFSHRLWLTSMHQELYRDVSEVAMLIGSSPKLSGPQISLVAELFMLILHVSPDDMQRFAGKNGEDEAKQVAVLLEENWAGTRDARYAVWHAGQVIRNARMLPPASLRGFRAIAVYFASLTLWIYGLLSADNQPTETAALADMAPPPTYMLVDGPETRESKAFLQLGKGVPGLSHGANPGLQVSAAEPLGNPGMVLHIARNVFRDNYPIRTKPLPPLVESLRNLLRDLGTGPPGTRGPSRAPSRGVSVDRSEE